MIKTNEEIETDKLLLSCTGLWEEFRINKTKDPISVQEYYNLISNLLDKQLNHSRMWLSSPHAKEYYYAEMQRQKEILQSLDMEWDDLLEQTYESVDDLIERVYDLGKQKGYNDIKEKLVFTDTDKEALNFVRQYNFHLIRKLSNDLRGTVKNTITQAVATGENPYSLANKIVELGVKPLEGSTLTPKQRAVMIAKTEVSRAQNTGILQSYVNEGYTEVTILTAEDSNVCSLCLDNAYLFNKGEDKVYHPGLKDNVHRISDLDENSILPLHPNCRCTYLSVWDSKNSNVEPYTVNLTPLNAILNNQFGRDKSTGKYNANGQPMYITEKAFKEKLQGKLSDEEITNLFNHLSNFKKDIHYENTEYASVKLNDEIIDTFTNGNAVKVAFPEWLQKEGLKNGIHTVIHNHPGNTSPLPSPKDLIAYTKCGVSNGVSTNKSGTLIIKNNNVTKNKERYNEIKKVTKGIVDKMVDDFRRDTPNWREFYATKKSLYDRKLENYVMKHNDRYVKMYQEKLVDFDMEVIFIK